MSGQQGHYEVTLTRQGGRPLRRTFPFGQWAEIGFWLDEIGAGVEDELAVRFRPLAAPTAEERWLAILGSDIGELELGVRAYNILRRQGIDTCAQVLALNLDDLLAWDERHADDPLVRWGRQAREQIREAQVGLQSMRLQLQAEIEAEAAAAELVPPFTCSVDESGGQRELVVAQAIVTDASREAHEAEHDPSRCRRGECQTYRIEDGRTVCVYCGEELAL